jgi:hypothetical protein
VQFAHHIGRCGGGCDDAVPGGITIRGQAGFGNRWYIGHGGRAFGRAHAVDTQLAVFHERNHVGHAREHDGYRARDHIGQGRAHGLVGHVGHLDTGRVDEKLHRQVLGRARAGGRIVDAARFGFGHGDQLGYGFGGKGRVADQHQRHGGGQRDRRKVFQRVIRQLGVQGRVGRHDAVVRHEERVAVGCGLCRRLGRDDAVGTRAVVYQHALANLLCHLRRDGAGNRVHRAACAKGHDDLDGPVGESLRRRGHGGHRQGHGQAGQRQHLQSLKQHGKLQINRVVIKLWGRYYFYSIKKYIYDSIQNIEPSINHSSSHASCRR